MWLFVAFSAGILYGCLPITLGQVSFYGIYARLIYSTGGFIFSIGWLLIEMIRSKQKKGYFYSWKKSNLRAKGGGIRWIVIWYIVLDAFINFFSALSFLLSLQFALYAQINQGIVTTLYSFTSIFMAIGGMIWFGEKF